MNVSKIPMTPTKRTPINQKLGFWLIILFVVTLVGVYRYQTTQNLRQLSPLLPVTVANVKSQDVPVYLSALGAVTPTYSVIVKTQINGQLLNVLFTEGQMVKMGDLLAEIDARPYQALLTQYLGQLERDQALLANAQVDLNRYQKLWKQNSISEQTMRTQQSLVQQYEGAIKNDEGLIQGVKTNLVYCRITSPMDGRVGLRLVDPGNVVQTTDTTGIAVINMLNPITVIFTLPEDNIPQILPQLDAKSPMEVKAYDRQQNQLLSVGKLLTIDNQIDPTTGTVKLKAEFANTDNHLFPNQFVNIQILVNTLHNANVIPTAAIQHGAKGDFVYRLDDKQTVHAIAIKSGTMVENNTTVTWGLLPGQVVVIDGADKLTSGIKVSIVNPKESSLQLSMLSRPFAIIRHIFL